MKYRKFVAVCSFSIFALFLLSIWPFTGLMVFAFHDAWLSLCALVVLLALEFCLLISLKKIARRLYPFISGQPAPELCDIDTIYWFWSDQGSPGFGGKRDYMGMPNDAHEMWLDEVLPNTQQIRTPREGVWLKVYLASAMHPDVLGASYYIHMEVNLSNCAALQRFCEKHDYEMFELSQHVADFIACESHRATEELEAGINSIADEFGVRLSRLRACAADPHTLKVVVSS
jgi:hypothetical protein